ncbi:MAG: sn-glycerol-3-phosphate ABC transporter ATP-binding protein UgpC [Elusimicrobia bacterium]|nr:sn-glycerol-3-phosphate ABC transporter ATP-binding protein UgpC [Elusimicrobiota bacterium]MDE2237055.1 sn-glycerol-3-phosphate ABC transporter ATP-binding protein UgpC [Elusimicrobiota bacterium]MDE2425367.1 sn-glycerol-3-phosphate ABC transporter ATP-binding protein UgpC [Elusimicrobiota bacterium]
MASVTLHGIGKSFGDTEVLSQVDLEVADREFLVFVGPSGCGKSTLLRIIAGLEEASGGDVLIGGQRVNDRSPRDREIAMVFQDYALYPHMTVEENMSFGLRLRGLPQGEIRARVSQAAGILQIMPLLKRTPRQLSGGQRQRVAIGRAIVRKPKVFLFDEPLSNLDAKLREEMRVEIAKLHQKLRTTVIYVTHDQIEAMTLANRIAILNKGRLQQVGAPEEVFGQPANTFVAGFIGSPTMNFVDGAIEANGTGAIFRAKTLCLNIPGDAAAHGASVILGIRPDHVWVSALEEGQAAQGIVADVEVVELLGSKKNLHLLIGDTRLLASVDASIPVRAGDSVSVRLKTGAIRLFDKASGNRL